MKNCSLLETSDLEEVIKADMTIKGKTAGCQIDSGESANGISTWHIKHSLLEQSETKLHLYNGTEGKIKLMLKNPKNG